MIGKILLTIILAIIAVPANGAFYGLVFGNKAERFVYPSVLVTWGLIVYFIWFR